MEVKVVGVDPSLRNFGIVKATLDTESLELDIKEMYLAKSESGTKKSKVVRKNSDDLSRARILHDAFQEAIDGAAMVFVEVPVGSQSARAMASYGVCIGVLASCGAAMIQVTPSEVKMAGTGYKTATKDEMIEAAVGLYPGAPWLSRRQSGKMELLNDNEHLADALFAIKAGMKTDEFKAFLSLHRSIAA